MQPYTAPSEIALRQLDYFADKHVLVAGEVEDRFPIELRQYCASVSVFTTHYGYYSQLKAYPEITRYFGEQLTADLNADLILLYWPKAKQEAEYLLAMLLAKLGTGTEIVVVGENRSGVKSIEKCSPLMAQSTNTTLHAAAHFIGDTVFILQPLLILSNGLNLTR